MRSPHGAATAQETVTMTTTCAVATQTDVQSLPVNYLQVTSQDTILANKIVEPDPLPAQTFNLINTNDQLSDCSIDTDTEDDSSDEEYLMQISKLSTQEIPLEEDDIPELSCLFEEEQVRSENNVLSIPPADVDSVTVTRKIQDVPQQIVDIPKDNILDKSATCSDGASVSDSCGVNAIVASNSDSQATFPPCPKILVSIGNKQIATLVDTGSVISIISHSLYSQLFNESIKIEEFPINKIRVYGAITRKYEEVNKQIYIPLTTNNFSFYFPFLVLSTFNTDLLLGSDWLTQFDCNLDFASRTVKINSKGKNYSVPFIPNSLVKDCTSYRLLLDGKLTLSELSSRSESQRQHSSIIKKEPFYSVIRHNKQINIRLHCIFANCSNGLFRNFSPPLHDLHAQYMDHNHYRDTNELSNWSHSLVTNEDQVERHLVSPQSNELQTATLQ